jgi:cell wall-associated NlpC family hydrolase
MTFAARITALTICALGTGIVGVAQAGPPQDRPLRQSPPDQHRVKTPAAKSQAAATLPAKLPKSPTSSVASPVTAATAAGTQTSTSTDFAAEVVFRALSLLGVNYRLGGNNPAAGLDCSGLVRLVYGEVAGLTLPRRSEEISLVGGSVDKSELQPGDLVFFNTLQLPFSHVGIFIGNGQFVHSPSSGSSVRVENINLPYWQTRFNGARRLIAGEPLAAAGSVMVVDTEASGVAGQIDRPPSPALASPAARPTQQPPDNGSRSSVFVN